MDEYAYDRRKQYLATCFAIMSTLLHHILVLTVSIVHTAPEWFSAVLNTKYFILQSWSPIQVTRFFRREADARVHLALLMIYAPR